MKVSFERKACKARLLSGTVNELMCVRDEGDCRLSASASLSGQADQGGERNVRFQRRNAQKKTSIVLNGSSKRGT